MNEQIEFAKIKSSESQLGIKINAICKVYYERKQNQPNSYDDVIADDIFTTMSDEEKNIIVFKLNENN